MALSKTLEFVHHDLEKARIAGGCDAGDVRAEKDILEWNDFAIRRYRLGIEDVETGDNIAALKALDQRFGIDDGTPRNIDQHRTRRDPIQLASTDHALCFRGQRCEADDGVALREDIVKGGLQETDGIGHLVWQVGVMYPDFDLEWAKEFYETPPDMAAADESDSFAEQVAVEVSGVVFRCPCGLAGDDTAKQRSGVAHRNQEQAQRPFGNGVG